MVINTIGVVGAGTMGSGIAQVAAQSGLQVTMVDVAPAALERAHKTIASSLDRLVAKDKLDAASREQALARMRTALSETVIEGINTNVALHRELLVDANFVAGGTNIHYLEEWLAQRKR